MYQIIILTRSRPLALWLHRELRLLSKKRGLFSFEDRFDTGCSELKILNRFRQLPDGVLEELKAHINSPENVTIAPAFVVEEVSLTVSTVDAFNPLLKH